MPMMKWSLMFLLVPKETASTGTVHVWFTLILSFAYKLLVERCSYDLIYKMQLFCPVSVNIVCSANNLTYLCFLFYSLKDEHKRISN
jgi:hypothetical protein